MAIKKIVLAGMLASFVSISAYTDDTINITNDRNVRNSLTFRLSKDAIYNDSITKFTFDKNQLVEVTYGALKGNVHLFTYPEVKVSNQDSNWYDLTGLFAVKNLDDPKGTLDPKKQAPAVGKVCCSVNKDSFIGINIENWQKKDQKTGVVQTNKGTFGLYFIGKPNKLPLKNSKETFNYQGSVLKIDLTDAEFKTNFPHTEELIYGKTQLKFDFATHKVEGSLELKDGTKINLDQVQTKNSSFWGTVKINNKVGYVKGFIYGNKANEVAGIISTSKPIPYDFHSGKDTLHQKFEKEGNTIHAIFSAKVN